MPIQLKQGGKDFDPVPTGVHHAICYGVVDVGTQDNPNSKYGPKPQLLIMFELPFERIDIPERGNLPRAISGFWTQSLGDKSNLRKLLESWRGKPFTPEQLQGFDPRNLIGINCQLNVIHQPKKSSGVFAKITSIIPLPKGTPSRTLENPELYFSLVDQGDLKNIKFPDNMPTWIQAKIQLSHEVLECQSQHSQEPPPAVGTDGTPGGDEDVTF